MFSRNEQPTIEATNPRRFSIKRDMTNGLFDVWDAYRCEYIACDVSRSQAERTVHGARKFIINHLAGTSYHPTIEV